MTAYLPEISLIVLLAVFVISAFKKNPIQIGILGFAAAFVIGRLAGIADTKIMSFFPSSLFIQIFCVLFFFSIPQANGAINLLAQKLVARFKCGRRLMPFVLYVIGMIFGSCGIQCTALTSVYTGLAIAVALSLKANPLLYALAAALGGCSGGYSPVNEFSVATIKFACDSAGLPYNGVQIYILNLVAYFVAFLAVYFVLGGYKNREVCIAGVNYEAHQAQELAKFNYQQIVSLLGIVAIIVLTVLGVNVGWAALIVGIVVILLKADKCDEALKRVSLPLLVLICGMGTLINVIKELGGFDVLSNILSRIMSPVTVAPTMCLTSSVFSVFAMGRLVILTLIPTLPDILQNFPGISALESTRSPPSRAKRWSRGTSSSRTSPMA